MIEDRPTATAVVTLPPPVTGMTLVNERIIASLQQRGDVTVINLAEGGVGHRKAWKFIRSLRHLRASLRVLTGTAGTGNLYIALNSGPAAALDIILVASARIRRRRIYVHHHSFRFINAPSPLLKALYGVGRDGITDIVLCDRMAAGLRVAYGRTRFLRAPNAMEIGHPTFTTQRTPGPIRLGHLANLSMEKGVGRVIEAFRHLQQDESSSELHLAGRFASNEARVAVELAKAEWPARFFYHGFVSGVEKSNFYAKLDLFLYPTDYLVEAQPLVLLEALAAGVPVITVARGCIGELADGAREGALTICELPDFSECVAKLVASKTFANSLEDGALALNAAASASEFSNQASVALSQLIDELLDNTVNLPTNRAEQVGTIGSERR